VMENHSSFHPSSYDRLGEDHRVQHEWFASKICLLVIPIRAGPQCVQKQGGIPQNGVRSHL
jgi:hypothetical protein